LACKDLRSLVPIIAGNPDLLSLGSGRSGSISLRDVNGSPARNFETFSVKKRSLLLFSNNLGDLNKISQESCIRDIEELFLYRLVDPIR